MKQIIHFSLSSHDEVMYRSEADLIWGFNCLALGALTTESNLMADGLMSTHHHVMAQTDNPQTLVKRSRYTYTRYFNAKYHRWGRLAERRPFILEIKGVHHLTVALNYVNRQGLHHGITTTPFGYPHCSANSYFRKELGRTSLEVLMPDDQRSNYLPDRAHIPSEYRMSLSGLLLREDVLDTAFVEQIYVTPRNYLFQMNRMTDDSWTEEQKKDKNNYPPVTLDVIEKGVAGVDMAKLLRNENGRINRSRMTDLELCQIIDKVYVPRLTKNEDETVYDLSLSERSRLGDVLWQEIPTKYRKTVTPAQISRCLCLKYG